MNHRVKTASIWKPRMIGLLCFTSLLSIVTALLDFMIPVAISIFLNWYKAGMLYSFWAFLGVLLPLCFLVWQKCYLTICFGFMQFALRQRSMKNCMNGCFRRIIVI